jgi:hypothetical protein
MPVILATWEAEIKRNLVPGQPRQIVLETPISKITRAKWTGSVAQVVEWLLCKCKSLSSNPSPTRKRERQKERMPGRTPCTPQKWTLLFSRPRAEP